MSVIFDHFSVNNHNQRKLQAVVTYFPTKHAFRITMPFICARPKIMKLSVHLILETNQSTDKNSIFQCYAVSKRINNGSILKQMQELLLFLLLIYEN